MGGQIDRFVMRDTGQQLYRCNRNYELKREQGQTPNGNSMNNRWVLRDENGHLIDYDKYRNDIAERNNLQLSD